MTVCYLALHGIYERGPMPPCEGRLIMAHLIPRQLLKREGGRWAIVDARSWVWACGGIMGNAGHHGAFDSAKTIRLPREALPDGTEELAALLGLTWWLDRTYQHTEGDQCPPTYGKPSTTSDLWEAQYNQRVMRHDFTVQDLMMEHQAMAYVLHMLPHTIITAQEQVARGRYDDVPGATRELVREQMTRKLDEYRAAA